MSHTLHVWLEPHTPEAAATFEAHNSHTTATYTQRFPTQVEYCPITEVEELKDEIKSLTHERRQGELEQANVGLADESRKLHERVAELTTFAQIIQEDCKGLEPTKHGTLADNVLKGMPLEEGHILIPAEVWEAMKKEVADLQKGDAQWNRITTELQAKVRFHEVGAHHCPDWDEMELKEGMVEFAVCQCKVPG